MSMNETKDGPIPAPIPDRATEEPDPQKELLYEMVSMLPEED